MKQHRIIISILVMICMSTLIFAEDEAENNAEPENGIEHSTSISVDAAYYLPNNGGVGQVGGFLPITYTPVTSSDGTGRTIGSTWGSAELQVGLSHSIKIPCLQGDNALVSGNNLKIDLKLNVAPVAVYGAVSATLTPIAFLNFSAGTMVGSGWYLEFMGVNGLGNNIDGDIDTTSFSGVVIEPYISGTFQFDLAAIVPGEWTHVVTQVTAKIKYDAYTTNEAISGTPWQWLADTGENLNGFSYEGSYVLGYQMPLAINLVGFLVTTTQKIGANSLLSTAAGADGDISTTSDNGWGSDFVTVGFGPVANFQFNDNNSLTLQIQFKTGIDYTDATTFEEFYQNRVAEGTYVKFNRIAFSYTHSF